MTSHIMHFSSCFLGINFIYDFPYSGDLQICNDFPIPGLNQTTLMVVYVDCVFVRLCSFMFVYIRLCLFMFDCVRLRSFKNLMNEHKRTRTSYCVKWTNTNRIFRLVNYSCSFKLKQTNMNKPRSCSFGSFTGLDSPMWHMVGNGKSVT